MRALILGLSILAIVASAHIAKAGLTTTPREQSASVDTATITEEKMKKPKTSWPHQSKAS